MLRPLLFVLAVALSGCGGGDGLEGRVGHGVSVSPRVEREVTLGSGAVITSRAKQAVERFALRGLTGLPQVVQRRIGRPVVRDPGANSTTVHNRAALCPAKVRQ